VERRISFQPCIHPEDFRCFFLVRAQENSVSATKHRCRNSVKSRQAIAVTDL
jgi:hypothetical protein